MIQRDDVDGKYVYGGTFVALMKALKKKKGSIAFEELMKDMVAHGYQGPTKIEDFKLKKRYALRDYLIFFDRAAAMFGVKTTDEMSREGAKREGIMGWFIKWAATPSMIMKNAGKYWKEFYDFGEMHGEMLDRNKARVVLNDGCYSDELCSGHTAYFRGVFESIGCKNVEVKHTKCMLRGDDIGEWILTWE